MRAIVFSPFRNRRLVPAMYFSFDCGSPLQVLQNVGEQVTMAVSLL